MSYKIVRAEWEYCFYNFGAPDDMTGGYIDQEDLDIMLKNPTKKQAVECMEHQLVYGFFNPGFWTSDDGNIDVNTDKKLKKIHDKYRKKEGK